MPRHVHSISIQGPFCATIPSVAVPQDRLTRVLRPHSEPSPVHKSPLFSRSRMLTPTAPQDQLPGSSSQGPGRVERWIEDQRGEDQDPHRLSPMPRHSDTIVHSRRLIPVTPRTPPRRHDISDFVFVDDDEQVSMHDNFRE